MPLVRVHRRSELYSCDGRFEFVRLLADGKIKINQYEIEPERLGSRVAELMQNRAVRVVYVVPDSGITYARFAEALARLNAATDDLHIVVLSGETRDTYFEKQLEPCDIRQ